MENNRALVLALVFIAVGTAGVSITTWFGGYQTVDSGIFPGVGMMRMMGGATMPHRMRGMMHGMGGGQLPPAVEPQRLPDPDGSGAALLRRYCAQCHNLPSPTMYTTEGWAAIYPRMIDRMEAMSGMGGMMRRGMMAVEVPTAQERQELLAYLQRYALRSIDPEKLGSPDTPGSALFRTTCSQCHALPDPALHTPEEWPSIVERMRKNMEAMGKRVITDRERDEIAGFLAKTAGS